MDGGHVFRTMYAYEQWFLRDGGEEGKREVAVLRLMGLFDRPADAGCLAVLRGELISGLTESLAGLADDDWEYCLSGLEAARLLTVNRDFTGALVSLDTHPHIREYFAKQLREKNSEAWRVGHKRLYEYLCKHEEGDQPTLEDLQPLYQAVGHGCQAGLQQDACSKVYFARIGQGNEAYCIRKLGAVGSDLGAVAHFFEQPWSHVSAAFTGHHQAWLLSQAAFRLRALGRLAEALEPMRAGVKIGVEQKNWVEAARRTTNLSELELTLGEIVGAVRDAELSVTYADFSGDSFICQVARTARANALHQAGRPTEAKTQFHEAEQLQAESQPNFPLLYSQGGFQYCELLLIKTEWAAWQIMLQLNAQDSLFKTAIASCKATSQRAMQILKWAKSATGVSLLEIALIHLTLGRIRLFEATLTKLECHETTSDVEKAVSDLHHAGMQHYVPCGLLTRAWLRATTNDHSGSQADLDEAWEIAERGPMRLHMADIHLYRARLFYRVKPYPWESPEADLKAAEKLIIDCGYHRRDEELADAKRAILGG